MIRRPSLGRWVLLASAVVAGFPGALCADDKAGPGQSLKLEARRENPPAVPNFARAYGLAFESLTTAGQRLCEARQKCDPVGLALIATEIGVAEKVSGRKVDVTAEALRKEAVELAEMRGNEKELTAVAQLIPDQDQARKLNELASKAGVKEAERVSRFKSGERDKGIDMLEVQNQTPVNVSIRMNGQHIGWVNGLSTVQFNVGMFHEHNYIRLSAHDQFGNEWKSQDHTGHHHFFTWTLMDGN